MACRVSSHLSVRTLLGIVCVVFFASLASGQTTKPLHLEWKNELPASVWSVLNDPDRFELISIDPAEELRRPTDTTQPTTAPASTTTAPVYLEDFRVLGSVQIADPHQRSQVNDALRGSMREWPHMYSGCEMHPRHAIRAVKGDTRVELLICFECGDVDILVNGKHAARANVNMEVPPIFNDLLTAGKVPRVPATMNDHAIRLTVDDVNASADFAKKNLGFVERRTGDGLVSLAQYDANLNLILFKTGSAALPEPLRHQKTTGVVIDLLLSTGIASEEGRLRAAGVTITLPLKEEPSGEKRFQVTDPNGIVYQIVQPANP